MTTFTQPAPNPFEATHPKQAFFGPKPPDIDWLDWLEHQANPFRFIGRVNIRDLIEEIRSLSLLRGYTFFRLKYLANKFGVTVRWMGELLRRLAKIGVIEYYKDPKDKRNRYRINPRFLALMLGSGGAGVWESSSSTSSSNAEKIAVTLSDVMVCGESKAPEELHDTGTLTEGTFLKSSHACARAENDEIIATFETVSGKKFDARRDGQALKELKKLNLKAALYGIYATALNIIWSERKEKPQPQSLAYFIPEAQLAASVGAGNIELGFHAERAKQKFEKERRKEKRE